MIKNKVVLVPFPFDDLSGNKVRPAVCLTHEIGPHGHVILAFITSRIPENPLETDIVIKVGSADFLTAGLRVSSTFQLHRLMTVTRSMLLRELGILSPDMVLKVEDRLSKLFGLKIVRNS